jgi:hypothetical protein
MSFESAAQEAIFAALNNTLPCRIYDAPPGLPAGQPEADFPYVVIGDDTTRPWDTDDSLGATVTITLHFWSRYNGRREVKTLMALAHEALHRGQPAVSGFRTVDCLHEFSSTPPVEADGKTRHGIQRYRLTLQKEQ